MDQLCPSCLRSDDLQEVPDIDGTTLIKYCTRCDQLVGCDDTLNGYDFFDLISHCELKMDKPCECGNDDPMQFQVQMNNDTEELRVTCRLCFRSQPVDVVEIPVAEDSTLTVCECGETGVSQIVLCRDEIKEITHIVCQTCNRVTPMTSPSMVDGYTTRDVLVQSLEQIRPGDHIKWPRLEYPRSSVLSGMSAIYYHHGIAIEVHPPGMLCFVEYQRDDAEKKFKVQESWLEFDPIRGKMYKIEYDRCNPEEVVIAKAKSRLGESSYNILFNNCEHFALCCKTGSDRSFQVK